MIKWCFEEGIGSLPGLRFECFHMAGSVAVASCFFRHFPFVYMQ